MAILFPRGSHPFDTPWYSWPFAWRGIYFNLVRDWAAAAATIGQPQTFGFFLHPNPYVSIGTAGGVALAASLLTWRLLTVCAAGIAACVGRARQPPHNAATATRKLAHLVRPGGAGSLVLAQLLHWLPYATQARQTFLIYYLPAYYFSILLLARGWHAFVCVPLRLPVAVLSTVGVAAAVGASSWQLAPIAYGSEVRLDQWTAALRLASTECWGGATCWVE